MSKKEYRGAVYLSILILMVLVANHLVNSYYLSKVNPAVSSEEGRLLDSLVALLPMDSGNSKSDWPAEFETTKPEKIPLQLHNFDPNTIEKADWISMGLPEHVFRGFEKYRAKGGRIRKPEDIAKLYHLDPMLASKIIPFVKLDTSLLAKSSFQFKPRPVFPEKKIKMRFDLNLADTTQLMSVFGIGRGIANRIVRHRDGLGGFAGKDYVYDVFGLDSAVVEELFEKAFLAENPNVQKSNLNLATEEELAKNPYIRKGLAKIICKYRQQHGSFQKAEDLLQIKIIKPGVVQKLKPYLAF